MLVMLLSQTSLQHGTIFRLCCHLYLVKIFISILGNRLSIFINVEERWDILPHLLCPLLSHLI